MFTTMLMISIVIFFVGWVVHDAIKLCQFYINDTTPTEHDFLFGEVFRKMTGETDAPAILPTKTEAARWDKEKHSYVYDRTYLPINTIGVLIFRLALNLLLAGVATLLWTIVFSLFLFAWPVTLPITLMAVVAYFLKKRKNNRDA